MQQNVTESTFERALSAEILASEQMRIRVLAATIAFLLVLDQLLLFFLPETLQHLIREPIPTWLPLQATGPFLVYELIVLRALRYRISHGKDMPTTVRFGNALIEISLPTLILWWINKYTSPAMAFGAWPSMLYFIFIAASTLRLDFVLSVFTGAMAACEYLVLAYAVLPLDAENSGVGAALPPHESRDHAARRCRDRPGGVAVAEQVSIRDDRGGLSRACDQSFRATCLSSSRGTAARKPYGIRGRDARDLRDVSRLPQFHRERPKPPA